VSAGATLFISDLHLDAARPEITGLFLTFLRTEAAQAQALYILGDLFEAWVGDDDPDPEMARVQDGLAQLTRSGVPCYVMHGNRDFLLGRRFCSRTGARLLKDGSVIELHGHRVLLLHGDTLCTDDHDYQRLRRTLRNPFTRTLLRALSLKQRQRLAQKLRQGSKAHLSDLSARMPDIMDVNNEAVTGAFRRHRVRWMIHGHTHRPAVHNVQVAGRTATRIVLGDWYEQGSVLRWDESGYALQTVSAQQEQTTQP
jgi:UDP-2,3-diacylglucosamine hydrolase